LEKNWLSGSAIPILRGRSVLWRGEAMMLRASTTTTRFYTRKEKTNLPFALGSCTLNRLAVLVETLGAPVLRFMLNLRLANDILPAFALLSGMSVGVCPHRNYLAFERPGERRIEARESKG
jgi:hypothetical protein